MVQFCCGVLSRSPSRCERAETRTASPRLIPYPREIIQEQIASILPLLNQPRSPTPFRLQHPSYQAACQKQRSYLEEWYRTHWSKSVCLNIRVFLEGTGGDRREVRVAERWDYHGGIKTFRRRTRVKKKKKGVRDAKFGCVSIAQPTNCLLIFFSKLVVSWFHHSMVFIIFVRWTPKSLWGSNHLPRHLDSYEKILATPLVQGQVWTHRRVDCEGLLPQASLSFGGAKIKNTTSVIVRAAKSRGLLGPFRLWALISFITTGWDLLQGLETDHKHYG